MSKYKHFVAYSLYGVFAVPLGQFNSGTYPEANGRETSHLRLQHVTRNAWQRGILIMRPRDYAKYFLEFFKARERLKISG